MINIKYKKEKNNSLFAEDLDLVLDEYKES